MVLLSVLDVVLVVLGGAGMLYQAVCIVISLFAKPIKFPEAPMNKRYAVLISARNEANVIGNLIDCLHSQTYPSELIDIWLVADNCTDNTAEVARNMGCHVIERFNKEQVGKGYALTYLLDQMNESGASDPYDAFFVFDADKILSVVKTITGVASKINSSAATINALASKFDGMMIGFELKKQ